MATSQNGWTVLQYGDPNVTDLVVDGVAFEPGVRKGDVHTVLQHVAEQVAARTGEKPVKGQCWGQSVRDIRGGTGYSNHASATAIDYNSVKHPQYSKPSATWSAAQISAIHKLLAELDGVVRWGGDYNGDYDSMHFEINANAAAVAKVAAKLKAKPVSPPRPASGGGQYESYKKVPAGSRVIGQNTDGPWSCGSDVEDVQDCLNKWYPNDPQLVVDGEFGPATTAAVKRYQKRAGLTQDGFVGPKTWKGLGF